MAQACSYWHLGDIDKWSMCFLAKFETKPRTLMKVDLEIELAYINIFRICHSLSQIMTYCACWAGAANFTRRAYQDVPSLIGFVSSQTSERSSERSVRRYICIYHWCLSDGCIGYVIRDVVACVLSFCCIAHTPLRPSDTFAALSSAAAVCRLPP